MRNLREMQVYKLGEQIVHLQDALAQANQNLKNAGILGVLPDTSVSFRKAQRFHKRVRTVLQQTY